MIRCCSKDRVDKNKNNNGKPKNERDLCHICPSKLSKRELEDLYYTLLTQNLDLKQQVNEQSEKLRHLSTKIQRNTELQKLSGGKDNKDKDCCIASKNLLQEQKSLIFDLKRHNLFLKDQIKLLNMKLCSAKQFLKRGQQSSNGKAIKTYTNGSAKSGSTRQQSAASASTVSSKKKNEPAEKLEETDDENEENAQDKIIRVELDDTKRSSCCAANETKSTPASSAPAPPINDKLRSESKIDGSKPMKKSTSFDLLRVTEIKLEPEESVHSVCNENNCKTLMEEMKRHIDNLTKELSKTHEEYFQRISKLEEEVSALHSENMLMLHEQANRDQFNRDANKKLALERAESETLQTDLKIQKRKVAELETQIKLNEMTQRTVDDVAGRRRDTTNPEINTTSVPGEVRRACFCRHNNIKKNVNGDSKKCACKPDPKSSDALKITSHPKVACACNEELQKKHKTWMDFFSKRDSPHPTTCQCKLYDEPQQASSTEALVASGDPGNEEGAIPAKALKDSPDNSETSTDSSSSQETPANLEKEETSHVCDNKPNAVIDTGTLRIRIYKKNSEIKPPSEPDPATKQKATDDGSNSTIETQEQSALGKSPEGADSQKLRNDLAVSQNKNQDAKDKEKTVVGLSDLQEPNKAPDLVDSETPRGQTPDQQYKITVVRVSPDQKKIQVKKRLLKIPDRVATATPLISTPDQQNKEPDITSAPESRGSSRVQEILDAVDIENTRANLLGGTSESKESSDGSIETFTLQEESSLQGTPDRVDTPGDLTPNQKQYKASIMKSWSEPTSVPVVQMKHRLLMTSHDKPSELPPVPEKKESQENIPKNETDNIGSGTLQKLEGNGIPSSSKSSAGCCEYSIDRNLILNLTSTEAPEPSKLSPQPTNANYHHRSGAQKLASNVVPGSPNLSPQQTIHYTQRSGTQKFANSEVPNSPKSTPHPTNADNHQRSGTQKLASQEVPSSPKSPQPTTINNTQRSEAQKLAGKKDVPQSSKHSPGRSGSQKVFSFI